MADDISGYKFSVRVKTGDVKEAGTDANVWIVLLGQGGVRSQRVHLYNFFKDDFEKGNLDIFQIATTDSGEVQEVTAIELERDDWGLKSEWFVERIIVDAVPIGTAGSLSKSYVFPLHRWVGSGFRHMVAHLDTSLPQHDVFPDSRRRLLEENRDRYKLLHKGDGPVRVNGLPLEEEFSFNYTWDINKMKITMLAQTKIRGLLTSSNLNSFDDYKQIYSPNDFPLPETFHVFQEDWHFGLQRLNGVNPRSIALCRSIPPKLAVTDAILSPLLEGLTLQEATDQRRLFIVDHAILHEFPCRTPDLIISAPVALFFLNQEKKLRPVAIQLFQQPGPDNPVFLPTDDHFTWLMAKMWFNNADATVHQALTHLGFTHLLMEGFALAARRNLAQSHPLFKLLAPHFLYIMAINSRAVDKLVSKGGWVDETMAVGSEGLLELVARGLKFWRLDIQGTLPADLENRGVLDPAVLPGYYYRDDALLLYSAIRDYVSDYVTLYYDSEKTLENDHEVQAWIKELTTPRESGGFGVQGIPVGSGFNLDALKQMLTCIIYTCSVEHAAANFPQYQEYGFPGNYPAYLSGRPPKDKTPRTEAEVVSIFPSKSTILDTLIIVSILSKKGTKSLGDFEVSYIVDPQAEAIVHRFRERLNEVTQIITQANAMRNPKYDYLDPRHIPNSIAI